MNTERLVLRTTDETDAELVSDLEAREEVGQFIGGLSKRLPNSHYFTILRGGDRIGLVALIAQADPANEYALVCAVLGSVEGCGIATEACSKVMQWAFDHLRPERIVGRVQAENTASLALVAKLKMREVQAGSGSNERCFVIEAT